MTFKIATWNVNSLKVRLGHVLDWIKENKPDVLALQEIKLQDIDFPEEEIAAAGYNVVFSGQKTYNGVAILSKNVATDPVTDLDGLDDPQRRVLGATIDGLRIIDLYVPNGQSVDSDKYIYKLDWLQHLHETLQSEMSKNPNLIILGDFNIAPEDKDVHEPALWEGKVLCSDKERAALRGIVDIGFADCFRLFEQDEKVFSWWDYRMNEFRRKRGLRIDLIFASHALKEKCIKCYVDIGPRKLERPSDHAPVVAEFEL